ncbi:MAG: competence protein ComK [Bacilli bacterium]|nr:competence protein ComK [Bacilli bacterium]
MINYIEILNRQIKINGKKIINLTFEKYINNLLIKDLTTYQGRINSIKEKYNYRKLVPIYIDLGLCLIPICNKKSINNLYINIHSISSLTGCTTITFKDNQILNVDKNIRTIKSYIKRASIISKD